MRKSDKKIWLIYSNNSSVFDRKGDFSAKNPSLQAQSRWKRGIAKQKIKKLLFKRGKIFFIVTDGNFIFLPFAIIAGNQLDGDTVRFFIGVII